MDQDYKRVLSSICEHSPLHDLAKKGAAPQDVKAVLLGSCPLICQILTLSKGLVLRSLCQTLWW
jgi:hypothetical protein